MKILKAHGPIFLLMLATVFAAFGRLITTPLWDGADAQVICDAHVLALDPGAMFRHVGFYFSQPLLQLVFLAEYRLFGLDPAGYLAVNLLIHALNAFVVYMLVNMLFPRRGMAILAGLLFALGVGSYGRVFTTIHALENLLLAMLHLLVLYFFIRNDFRRDGRLRSTLFVAGLALFLASGLTRASSFSLLSCLVAYKAFFHRRRGRPVWSPDLLIFIAVGTVFYLGQARWGYGQPTIFGSGAEQTHFSLLSVKNLFRYLVLMFFPLQKSPLLETAPFWVDWLFVARTWIRFALTIAIVSYSFFGFVFGSRAIRFFIAWTYITLLPFTAHTEAGRWLNLNHLYLASLGFCVVLSAGAAGCSSLLARAGRRRFLPYLAPLLLAAMAVGLTHQLDSKYKVIARWPAAEALRAQVREACSPAAAAREPGDPLPLP
jgi:hypothetical protein